MRTPKVWFIALGLAGILECGMAMAHFGLQALNFSWGVLLLGIGGLVLYAATLKSDGAFLRTAVVGIGLSVVLVLTAGVSFYVSFYSLKRTTGTIVSSGQKREYLLYVPTSYDRAKPTPLVISLHATALDS